MLLCNRCANTRQGPTGGAKDTIPPVLLRTSPAPRATGFADKKMVLTFNEYMALKDIAKNVVMSPPSLRRPTVQRRGKDVQVVFQDTLLPDRTYTIDFGNALADNNEGNLFPPYRFVFSTGATIDSMAFVGVVRDAYTQDPLPGATVMLYENMADSAVYKELPVAVARTDSWGYFSLQHVAPKSYRMFAVEDKNSNYRYDSGNEKIAFLDTIVVPELTVAMLPPAPDSKDTSALLSRPFERLLLASTENVRKQFLNEYPQLGKRQFKLVFNQYHPVIHSFNIHGVDSSGYTVEYSRFRDTLTYWITAETLPDTLRATLNYNRTDSLDNLSPTEVDLRFTFKEPEEKTPEKKEEGEEVKAPVLRPKIDFNQQLGMKQGVLVAFDALPVSIDTSKITLFKLNAEKKTREKENFRWLADTSSLRRFYVQAKWITVADYELEILPDAFKDVYGLVNDSIVKKITTPNPDKFCHITFDLADVSGQYIVQMLNNKKEEAIISEAGKLLFEYLPAGDYCIRLIADENRDGVWSPSVLQEKKQPEKVAFLKFSATSELLSLRENFEVEQTVNVNKLFEEVPVHFHVHDYDHDHDGHNHEAAVGSSEETAIAQTEHEE